MKERLDLTVHCPLTFQMYNYQYQLNYEGRSESNASYLFPWKLQ